MRYLDPKNDLTFKKIFGEHPHLLKSFLNAMLPLDNGQLIESIEYLASELPPRLPHMKHTIVDVRCKDNSGRQFIVEMQMCWTDDFKQRVVFNSSKAYIKQLDKGDDYQALQPVYALSLVNDIFEPKLEGFYHHYKIVHIEHSDKVIEGLEFVFVELPKFKPQNISDKRLQVLWLRFLTEIKDGTSEISSELFDYPDTKEAIACLQESSFTEAELEYYDKYWDSIQTEKTLFEGATKKGKIEGRIEGIIEVAEKLKSMGVDVVTIQKSTGLSKEEIEKL
ncbi:MAG: Rpn family recombination-promoting nuclease/putative transposase [Bacteroidota bacterium]